METELLLHLVKAVDRIEKRLDDLDHSIPEHEWLDPVEFCKLAGLSREALRYAVQKGKIHGPAIRNTGTAKRQHLRYHRQLALDQYLNNAAGA